MHKTKIKLIELLFCSMLAGSTAVWAQTQANTGAFELTWHPLFTVSGGFFYTNDAGENQYYYGGTNTGFYNYIASNQNQTNGLAGIYFANEFFINPSIALQVGVSYYHYGQLKAEGTVYQGANISSQSGFSYQYYLNSYQILAESKLLFNLSGERYKNFYPYVSAGLGAANTRFSGYNVDIQPDFITFTNQFGNNSQFSFSYILGFGFDYEVKGKVPVGLGLGYRFVDLGSYQSGKGVIDTANTTATISQSHVYLNELVAQLTYVFG